ncbi:MAG: exodeoxyribonuclease VII small subunit [Chrysiogenales bacterium]|nr:MAG: exodeoxyribonuclease VII small subunit [Chrysiogenales bacterium]
MEKKKNVKRTPEKGDTTNFETSLKELESIAEKLEAGEMSLDESIRLFEKGMRLTRICREKLDEAEKRIEILQRTGSERVSVKVVTVDGETGEIADDDELQGSLL